MAKPPPPPPLPLDPSLDQPESSSSVFASSSRHSPAPLPSSPAPPPIPPPFSSSSAAAAAASAASSSSSAFPPAPAPGGPSPAPMTPSPRPQHRTSNTCVTCRARKVRCDGRRGICTNCERLGFSCSYDENVAIEVVDSPTGTSISVPRRRVRQACLSCHAKKARCSGQTPKCDRCRVQGIECVYRPGKRSLGTSASAGLAGDPSSGHDPSKPLSPDAGSDRPSFDYPIPTRSTASPITSVLELSCPDEGFDTLALKAFEKFFRHIHHIPTFSFLHRASLMERYHAGLLDRPLLLALIGLTSLFTDLGPGTKEFGARCVDEAASLVMSEFERPSILRLQALIIITKHRTLSRRFSGAFMLHAVACRFATALRLNHENPSLCFLAQESRRRLMWSLYMVDTGIASGQVEFSLWPDPESQIQVQLPCNERHFEFDLPEPTERLRSPPPGPDGTLPPLPEALGFLALHVRIHWLRGRIQRYTTSLVGNPTAEALAQLPARCAELASELDVFAARLPVSFRWSESNLRLRTYSPRLGIYIMTHIWWEQCHCDLYRLWLPGFREALPEPLIGRMNADFSAHCRRQCYEHARTMADMFSQVLALGNDIPVSDLDLPVCAYQCARMLFHGYRTSSMELGMTAESVQELANVCLRVAKQSTAGLASESIQADLEKLIANGLSMASGQPQLLRSGGPMGNTAAMLGHQLVTSIEPSSTAAPAPAPASSSHPPLVERGPLGIEVSTGDGGLSGLQPASDSPPLQAGGPESVQDAGVESTATHITTGSNAFEGALDGFDFGFESLGVDSAMQFSGDLLNINYSQMEM